MKIKFEIKSNPTAQYPLFTIFMEDENRKLAKFKITKFNLRQLKMGEDDRTAMGPQDIPINDGLLQMNKDDLKEFIASLQCLLKAMAKR